MKDLSISQEYFLCVLNENGKLPALSSEIPVCLLAGGIIDLICANDVTIGEDKKLRISGELSDANQHLNSVYTFIKESKPMEVGKLASEYAFTFSDKRIKQLINDVGTSLVNLDCACSESCGMFSKMCFFPNKEVVDHVIQNIRAELIEDGVVSDNIVALVSLLEKSGQTKKYFSKYEKDQLKTRLKEIKNTDSNKLVKEMVDYVDTLLVAIIASTSAH